MNSNSWILIGVGGAGSKIAHIVQKRRQSHMLPKNLVTVGIDSDLNDLQHDSLEQTIKIGGVNTVGRLLRNLAVDNDIRRAIESRLPDLALKFSMSEGAGQLFELGQLAFEVSKQDVARTIRRALNSLPGNQINVVIVGSLCGGTASAVIPAVANLLNGLDDVSHRLKHVFGFGLSSSCFRGVLPNTQDENIERNEYLSLAEIKKSSKQFFSFQQIGVSSGSLASWNLDVSFDLAADAIISEFSGGGEDNAPNTDLSLLLTRNMIDIVQDDARGLSTTEVPDSQSGFCDPAFLRKIVLRMGQVHDFQKLVNNPNVRENDIQTFLAGNRELITGFDYKDAQPHVILEKQDGSRLIPDFMLIPFESGFADVLELKMPKTRLVTRRGIHDKLTSDVEAAMAQLRNYRDFFEQDINREKFHETYGYTSFRPRLSLLVGRNTSLASQLSFRKLVSNHEDIQITTYDDLISKATRLTRF